MSKGTVKDPRAVPGQGTSRDAAVTGRAGAPAELAASIPMSAASLLRVLWSGVESGLVLYDAQGARLMTNPAAEQMLGADGRITGRVVYLADGSSVIPEDAWPLRRALAGEIIRNEELVFSDDIHPDGVRLLVTAYPIDLEDGTRGALIAFHDVTQSRRDMAANRSSLDQLNMLLEGAAGYAILKLGPDGEVRSWSDSAQRLLGYQEEEILGEPYSVFFGPQEQARGVPELILASARNDGSAHTDGPRHRKDGSMFWSDGVMTAIRNSSGDVTAFVKVIHDVTSRYEAERSVERLNSKLQVLNDELEARVLDRTAMLENRTAELLSTNTELEGFSYSVSHDLRGPVRAVHGFSRLLRERYGRLIPGEGQILLDRIEEGAVRMGELIDALLRLSRMQRQPMSARRVDMGGLVRQCWDTLDGEFPGHTTELALGELDDVHGDPQLLRQVWMNLLENAIKYSRQASQPLVRVSSRVEDEQVVYEVTDNGTGFDPRYASKLFKVFQRLHRSEDYEGIGIGLAIVHRVILRHGGTVWASSEPGRGASFSFSLSRAGILPAAAPVSHVG